MLHLRWLMAGLLVVTAAARAQQTQPAPTTRPATQPAEMPAPASSEDEQLSRTLLGLKAQREETAGKYGAADGRVRDLDSRIAAVREEIADRSGAFGAPANGALRMDAEGGDSSTMFPRIVSETGDEDLAQGQWPGGVNITETDSAATRAARQKLQDERVSLSASGHSLAGVLESIADQTGLNIQVNWAALQTAGLDRGAAVTLLLNSVTAERALKAVLGQTGAAAASLDYTVDEGVVILSTREDLSSSKYQVVRVYDVRDFVVMDWGLYPVDVAMELRDMKLNNLMDTIKSVVAPESWRDSGGTVGSIRELNGQLIINQTADNQRAVAVLLARLRQR